MEKEFSMDSKIIQANAELGKAIASSFLHDLRNLMCVISYQSEIGHGARDLEAEKLREIFGRIHEAARMTIDLIEGEQDDCAVSEHFDLRVIIKRVSDVVRGRGGDGTRVSCILSPGPVWMVGQPEIIMRVCLNLALNAVDASPGGEVTLSVSTQPELPDPAKLVAGVVPKSPMVMVEVADDGPGIPIGLRDSVWKRGVTTKGANGSGEGLALVRRLVEGVGAGIILEADRGVGTCFRMYWPSHSPEIT
jgi:two-component system, cell cycle sensor histidine kinase and response regulator CckA